MVITHLRLTYPTCVNLMAKLVPLIIQIMMDHPETLWGQACYPVVK